MIIKQKNRQNAIILVLVCTGIGAFKGLFSGLKRTCQRRESEEFFDDGGPVISKNDDFLTLIGSIGVIVTSSTIAGSVQGFCVGALSPIVIPCGIYHYYKNSVQCSTNYPVNDATESEVDDN